MGIIYFVNYRNSTFMYSLEVDPLYNAKCCKRALMHIALTMLLVS